MIANGSGHEQGRVMPLVALCLCTLHEPSLDLCHRERPEQTRRRAADSRAHALDTRAMGVESRRVSMARAMVRSGQVRLSWSEVEVERRRPRPGRCDATDQPSRSSSKTWQQGSAARGQWLPGAVGGERRRCCFGRRQRRRAMNNHGAILYIR